MRHLLENEKRLAYAIFGDSLASEAVRIHEATMLPNRIDDFGRWLGRRAARPPHHHNAICLGNHCLFPIQLTLDTDTRNIAATYQLGWLVHELTHVWQYQHIGWRYLWQAIRVQLQLGAQAYDYGGAAGLQRQRDAGWRLQHFKRRTTGSDCTTLRRTPATRAAKRRLGFISARFSRYQQNKVNIIS
jgi:hypothetical protein